ncbi:MULTISPECIES: DUF6262 family protein [Mycobacteriaceae]|uniref:Transposase n=2 Tax=Mycobacteriaceae TaxID=1762 RepID=A0A1A0MN83_MYCMU|nr:MULTISPECIES: DUF6262 family protein [Mycobacteriaceae]OBA86875.1 hypothetical protein A5642_21785 [Mycolicibacterium mucogenicum]OHU47513.1 hypothetical protein BKG82_25965 [Mycobacteroides chelonae]TDK92308.1 hypothetical protein EUA03_04040 [Mycolicibacterium mucogenicum]SLI53112.1 Tn554 transposase C [Mycobacteroides abscessus subsp. abscessus]SLJ11657.1 Tn554 transposase C [Mycobacteroides abscessus subsp. abscessus]
MTAANRERRTARLAEAAAARSADAAARARRAITKLHNAGQPITFVSVARAAGVSTSFLYQHRDLRCEIGERRTTPASGTSTSTPSSATVESLRTKLAVAVQRNRDLTEQIALLRTENEALRSRLLDQRCAPTRSAEPLP